MVANPDASVSNNSHPSEFQTSGKPYFRPPVSPEGYENEMPESVTPIPQALKMPPK